MKLKQLRSNCSPERAEARFRGFTLIETLVAIALSVIVVTALASMINYFYATNATTLAAWQSVSSDRANLEWSMTKLREASSITSAGDSSLSYETMLGGATTSASYTLSDATFTYYDASGTPLTNPVDPAQVRAVLVREVVNAGQAVETTLFAGAALRNSPRP